ncbi:MAG: TetR/AcrR family transcriptional regulator [Candidatus Dormibacteraeota bacterium]|nr:TetR/AcrR family transcriptional regulator [Candidatus Dormibacteraeota bacterium]
MPRVKSQRRYVSGVREDQARRTRLRILDAAHRLFSKNGYARTTIERIASEAGVATDTVYAVFRSKRAVLSGLMERQVGGDDQPIAMLDRPGPQSVRHEPNQRRQLARFVAGVTDAIERSRPIDDIMRSAAAIDRDISTLRANIQEERFRNMTTLVRWLRANGPLRGERSVEEAAAIVWTLTSPEVHRLLRVERGWSSERFRDWLGDTLGRTLLA